jgi:putative transposase
MTAALDGVASRKKDKPERTAEQKLAEELVARAREQGVSLTGPEGLLKQLTKTVPETALNQEMTGHLGHEKRGQPAAGDVRNGTRAKTVLAEASGRVGIEVPGDRAGTFEPQIVRKRQRRPTGGGPDSAVAVCQGPLPRWPSPGCASWSPGLTRY